MLKKPVSFITKHRDPEWYDEALSMDVRHLLGVPGLIVREPIRDQYVFLTPRDVRDILNCEVRSGFDLNGLARHLATSLSDMEALGTHAITHWEVQDDVFVSVLRFLKRECRSKRSEMLLDLAIRVKPIDPSDMLTFLASPDHSDDLAA